MSEPTEESSLQDLPVSDVKSASGLSIVWLVPIIAILSGAWVAYKAWSEKGLEILISFETAEGIEAGKTKIKYKNVEIGEVHAIRLSEDKKRVSVIADMDNSATALLTDATRFWVVKPRINASGVSGLETLMAGSYIGMDPNTQGKPSRQYVGLEEPPVIAQNIPGKHFLLHTENLGSLERDVPVYYRKYNVGRVENINLDEDGQGLTVQIFIRAPYDKWVNDSSKFWNVSGVDFTMDANGLKVNSESLVAILVGGVAFESATLDASSVVMENSEFKLYDNYAETLKKEYKHGIKYVINFSESVRGLSIGAPVEFRGMKMGEVVDIRLFYETEKHNITIPVTVQLDYGRVGIEDTRESLERFKKGQKHRINLLLQKGLRAQLKNGNLITGQLFIDFDFFKNPPPFEVDWSAEMPELPSIPGTLDILKQDLAGILKKAKDTLNEFQQLSYKLNHQVTPELLSTLQQTQASLVTIEAMLKHGSPLQQDLHMSLQEISKAARSLRNLSDYLERHPESLIQGKPESSYE